jgi:hypothetical protein
MSLGYKLMKKQNVVDSGFICSHYEHMQFSFVFQRFFTEKAEMTIGFPYYNDDVLPLENIPQFIQAMKDIRDTPIPVWQVCNAENSVLEQIVPGSFRVKELAGGIYEVYNECGMQMVVDQDVYSQYFAHTPGMEWEPYIEKGVNFEWMNQIKLENPVVIFQSFDFSQTSFGYLRWYRAMDSDRACAIPVGVSSSRILQKIKVQQKKVPLCQWTSFFDQITAAAEEALQRKAFIQWT